MKEQLVKAIEDRARKGIVYELTIDLRQSIFFQIFFTWDILQIYFNNLSLKFFFIISLFFLNLFYIISRVVHRPGMPGQSRD